MAIFRYEIRQLRNYTFWWAAASALTIFVMLPIYISLLRNGAVDIGAIEGNFIFDLLGVDINVITSPLGAYGFLTSFFAIAAGINGMYLGLKAFTKETVQKTADYIYTKPYKRGSIYLAKLTSSIISVSIVGICYFLGSAASASMNITGGFDMKTLSLIAGSFFLIQLYFVLFGTFVGAIYSKIRTPLLVSSGVTFVFYVISSFASKVNSVFFKFVSPFAYFGSGGIISTGSYDTAYALTFTALCIALAFIGYMAFVKKDVTFIS